MSTKLYVAIVKRVIEDQIEVQIEVHGDMNPMEIEKKVKNIASKLGAFDPAGLSTSVTTNLQYMELISVKDEDSLG
jgi:hypothetical protein